MTVTIEIITNQVGQNVYRVKDGDRWIGDYINGVNTQTSGINEAAAYIAKNGGKLELGPGTFPIYAQISIPSSIDIEGVDTNSGLAGTELKLMVNLGSNDVFVGGGWRTILRNLYFNGNNMTANSWFNWSSNPEGSYRNYLENLFFGENGTDVNFTWDLILDHMSDTVAIDLQAYKVSWICDSALWLGGAVGIVRLGAQNFVMGRVLIGNYIEFATGTSDPQNYQFNSIYFNGPSTSNFIVDTTQVIYITDIGDWLANNQNNGSPYPTFGLGPDVTSATVYYKCIDCYNPLINMGQYFKPYAMFATGITGKGYWNETYINGGFPGAWSDWQNWLSWDWPALGFRAISTPAVPASGTAVQNPYGFPIVAIITSAGAVTSWVITDGWGNSQTISTGLTAGQMIIIPPNGSITFNYTTAPAWVWMGM